METLQTTENTMDPAMNAVRHGMRAAKFGLIAGENEEEFDRFAQGVTATYQPEDAVEQHFVDTIIIGMWREIRADRIEEQIFGSYPSGGVEMPWAHQTRSRHVISMPTLCRYRSQAQMEVKRAIAMLEAHRKTKGKAKPEAQTAAAPRADDEKCTNEPVPITKPQSTPDAANKNCTNEPPSPDSKTLAPASSSSQTPGGEFERRAPPLSTEPTPQKCTNEPKVIVHAKQPVPKHLLEPLW